MLQRIKNTAPLCIMPDGKMVCYHAGYICVYENEQLTLQFKLFDSFLELFFGRCKYINRLLRLGVRTAMPLNEDTVILSMGCTVYELSIATRNISEGFYCGNGIRPLIFTNVNNLESIDDGVYFGGYLNNKSKGCVNIYKRTGIDNWDIVYTFQEGEINHVHNIIPDPYRNCLWILTGDFDKSAAIWKATDNFKKVERVLCNDQKYRGCVAFPVKEGLIYATDAPFAQNYIYLMKSDNTVLPLHEIDGSCIYGCRVGNRYVFSTTVEPDGRKNTFWRLFTYMKRGAGIKDMNVHMYSGNMEQGFTEIYKARKDLWPYAFQFGAFKFPTGENKSNRLYFQPIATIKHDMDLMRLEL